MFGYIYKTINLIDGMIYIGKKKGSFNPSYLGSGIRLINAVKKYNASNFVVNLLVTASNKDELNNLEKVKIAEYRRVFGKGCLYNISDGGDGGSLVRMFGSDNPMYNKKGGDNPNYIQREIRNCDSCGKEFEVRITSKQTTCSRKCGNKNKRWIYNPILNKAKNVLTVDVDNYAKDGWILGRGQEFKNKSSICKTGKKNPMFGKGYLKIGNRNWMFGRTGIKHPFFGKHHTEESNMKNRISHLEICNNGI